MNDKAEVLERRFEKSIIRSQKRFTYEEAQEVLDTARGPMLEELGHHARACSHLAQKARARGRHRLWRQRS
jgi:ribonuclease R